MAAIAETTEPTTVKATIPYALTDGAPRHRIGLIALETDEATERDFQRMMPVDDVAYFTARVRNANPVTIENLRKIGPRLGQSAAQILPGARLDSIAYSCTSGTVALGYDEVASQIAKGRPGVPVTTPITAGIAGLKKIGAKRITLFTPYIDSVNQAMRGFLEDHGIEVLNIGSFCIDDDLEMARVPPEAIRAVEILEDAEAALGKPVLSAIQCLFWDALRLAGYDKPIAGYGSLLRA